jgi:hypothetical protein
VRGVVLILFVFILGSGAAAVHSGAAQSALDLAAEQGLGQVRSLAELVVQQPGWPAGAAAAVALLAFLGAWGRRRMLRRRYGRLRLMWITYDLVHADGRAQLEGVVYPGVRELTVYARVDVPPQMRGRRFDVRLQVRTPTGKVASSLQHHVDASDGGAASLAFSLDQPQELFSLGGSWMGELSVSATGQVLGTIQVPVVTRMAMLSDLETEAAEHLLTAEGAAQDGALLSTQTAWIRPGGSIRPATLDPNRYTGFNVTVELVHPASGRALMAASEPLVFRQGKMDLAQQLPPINLATLADRPGAWLMRLCIDGQERACIPFTLITPDEAVRQLRVERLDILGIRRSDGRTSCLGDRVDAAEYNWLVPVVELSTACPSIHVRYSVVIGVACDDEPRCMAEDELALERHRSLLMPGELPVEDLETGTYSFCVIVNGRCVAMRAMEVARRLKRRRSDIQGQIVDDVLDDDALVEAEELLKTATVVR